LGIRFPEGDIDASNLGFEGAFEDSLMPTGTVDATLP
jgi:hypothetical protein